MNGLFHFSDAVRNNPTIERWLMQQSPELGVIARAWFGTMRACGQDVLEVMHDGCPTACAGSAAFAYVGVYNAHVNVGFFRGAELPDPAGLLEGVGKRMRHVKLTPEHVVDAASLEALIAAAYADMKVRLETT